IIDTWPNTYTFTKAIAESIIRKTADDLPIAIVRPSQGCKTLMNPLENMCLHVWTAKTLNLPIIKCVLVHTIVTYTAFQKMPKRLGTLPKRTISVSRAFSRLDRRAHVEDVLATPSDSAREKEEELLHKTSALKTTGGHDVSGVPLTTASQKKPLLRL
ncbi:unnamed protein product, partial [Timema podura]|nr:unnamed protein product [Timema podura]